VSLYPCQMAMLPLGSKRELWLCSLSLCSDEINQHRNLVCHSPTLMKLNVPKGIGVILSDLHTIDFPVFTFELGCTHNKKYPAIIFQFM